MKKILQKDEKPFDELLNDFVEGETKDEDPSTGSGQDEDEDDWEWDDYPDGEVELNDHAKIQLRILYPEPHPRQALERLEGCADIKARIDELVALTAFNRKLTRLMPGAKPHAVSLHSVFLGNPGTGKTTVCKIFGALLREAGALSLGHVVVCDRGSFIGTLWGDTERAVEGIVEQARGGVLMIDEAYLLHGTDDRDPARSVLPGLDSRFPNRFDFPDFTPEQLEQITLSRVDEYGYTFTAAAWEKYRRQLAEAWRRRDPRSWGNARAVANMLERIYVRHAKRCLPDEFDEPEMLLAIIEDDIPALELPRPQRRIGF